MNLEQVNGSVTHAASLLDMNYQSLAYIIEPGILTYSGNALQYAGVHENIAHENCKPLRLSARVIQL
jgi:hypothetical protein